MQETQCPQCGEWLGVPPEFADRPVRCGACGRVIQPHERGSSPPPPPARSAPQFPRNDDDAPASRGPRFPDQPEYGADAPPRKKGGLLWLWLLLGLGGFGFCCCGGLVAFVFFAAANPKWEPYTAENGAFTAEFPGKPVTQQKPVKWPDDKEGTGYEYAALQPLQQQGVGLHYTDIPKSLRKVTDDETLLKIWLKDFKAKSTNFTEKSSSLSKPGKYQVMDVEGTMMDPQHGLLQVSLRLMIVGDRAFLLVAAGKDRRKMQPMRDRFFDSFKPAEPKKDATPDPKEK